MPTPIGHALAGFAVAGLASRNRPLSVSQVGVLVFCATAPDLDLLGRFFDGVNHHRGGTHSLVAAVLSGVLGLLLHRLDLNVPSGAAMGAAWASHVLLDYLGLDTSPPSGEMALWPFSTQFYVSPVAIFYDVRRSFSLPAIQHNVVAVAIELVVLLPISILCWRVRRSGKS